MGFHRVRVRVRVQKHCFSMFPLILTFDFNLIYGLFLAFWGPNGLFFGVGIRLKNHFRVCSLLFSMFPLILHLILHMSYTSQLDKVYLYSSFQPFLFRVSSRLQTSDSVLVPSNRHDLDFNLSLFWLLCFKAKRFLENSLGKINKKVLVYWPTDNILGLGIF